MSTYQPGKPCHNNGAVVCLDHTKCEKCGWNPQVEEHRKKQLKQKRRGKPWQK